MSEQKKETRVAPTPPPRGHWPEVVGILLCGVALYLFIALFSYSPSTDPSFNSTGAGTAPLRNWGGVVGAYVSDFLVQVMGWAGFFIPALILFLGISRLAMRQWGGWLLRGSGGVVFIASLCVLLQLRLGATRIVGVEGRNAGGFVGKVLSDLAVALFAVPGAHVLVTAAFLCSIILATGISL